MLHALAPRDYDVVQTVFKALGQSEWFDRNDANEKACSRLVLLNYDGGLSEVALRAKCEAIARERFARRH